MGELYEPFPKLPKNIRQIGERDKVLKLYVEDYVNTYLKRLQPAKGADLRVGLLLGSRETHEDVPYVFVDGAVEMEAVAQEGEKVVFTDEAWKKVYQEVEQLFPKRTVQGWFLCGNPGCSLSPLNYWRQHSQYFTGKNQLMYLNCGLEGEEAAYITSSDGFYKLRGYSIYYERNQMMQDYMVLRKDVSRTESGVNDRVIQDFKQKMDERRYEAGRQRGTVGMLSGLCSALAVTVLAGGVAMFNNYQKMHEMESVIASVMPESSVRDSLLSAGIGSITQNSSGKGWSGIKEPDYVIEQAAGNVFPTSAPGETEGKEKPSELIKETMPPVMPPTGTREAAQTEAGVQTEENDQTGTGVQTGENDQTETGAHTNTGDSSETASKASEAVSPSSEIKEEEAESSGSAAKAAAGNLQVYIVGEGESLYGICYKLYKGLGNAEEICRLNGLKDQNSIFAGQKLLVP